MDYRKAWDEVKAKLEESLEEGRDNGYDDGSETYYSGMYDAYKRVFDHVVELESAIVVKEIRVGDTVRVVKPGMTYPKYEEWIKDNITNPFFAAKWGRERRLAEGLTGLVRYIAPHGFQERALAYVEISNACYIIDLEGLEKVERA